MNKHEDKLAGFLREVSNWRWDDFARAEHSHEYTSNEAIIFATVRACVMRDMSAIKLAVNRLDGKLVTPIRVEYPKIYYLFPNAITDGRDAYVLDDVETLELPVGDIVAVEASRPDEPDLPSMGFRETLRLMSDYPRELPQQIVDRALATEQWLRHDGPEPDEVPMVKSVVAAHLLTMAQKRNIDAINEVFDAIDGKLVETIQVLGEDLYITDFSMTAPPDAKLNKDGVLQMEATVSQNIWAQKLGKGA